MSCTERIPRRGGWRLIAPALCAVLLAACGGGGGGGGTLSTVASGTTTTSTGTSTGTSSGSSTSTTTAASAANVAPIIVDSGPAVVAASTGAGTVNIPFVSVTVCSPTGTNCQTIDHVIVDTASVGLRLIASAMTNTAQLPAMTNNSGNPYAECAQFASGYSWGSLKLANVSISGENAASLPIQIIGDTDAAFSSIPSSCTAAGAAQNTVAEFGGNGVLGIGVFKLDCGSACVTAAVPGTYYTCSGTCSETMMPLAQQVANPVTFFPVDNNGVVVELPAIAAGGASSVAGSLVFGIGTQSNNALGSAKVYGLSGETGDFTAVSVAGNSYPASFLDSGSNFYFFDLSTLTSCAGQVYAGFYCPSTSSSNPLGTTTLTATFQGSNGATGTATVSIGNAATLFTANPNGTAFNDIGGTMDMAGSFDFGLPFFYGRNVFSAMEGATTPGSTGPYVAF